MSRFTNLGQWTGPTTSLRPIGPHVPVADHDEGSGKEDARPSERVPVYGYTTRSRRECDILLTTRSLATEAAALSFMATSPHDVRPAMLLAMFGEDQRAIAQCLRYAFAYLLAWCNASGVTRGEAAIRAAAADALAVMYRRRATMAADERARDLGMRAETYRDLRNVALRMYRRRLQEACERFHTGRIHTRESSYSVVGRLTPPAPSSSRAEPRNARQPHSNSGRSPAGYVPPGCFLAEVKKQDQKQLGQPT